MLDIRKRLTYSNYMNHLSTTKRAQIIGALVEGNSVRATARMTDTAFNTVLKLVPEIGAACERYQDNALRNLPCKRIQCDEIWQFCYAKSKNVPEHLKGQFGIGDVWTWTAICADTKLAVAWHVGERNWTGADALMQKVATRVANRVQLTTDGLGDYVPAVETHFGTEVDFAQLIKLYGAPREAHARYSPAECLGCRKQVVSGEPERTHISTSYVERANLTMRMGMRRFTRLTNAFSKKVENHSAAVALHFMHYNFARIHKTLRVTPAMEAGLTDHVWGLEEIAGLLDRKK